MRTFSQPCWITWTRNPGPTWTECEEENWERAGGGGDGEGNPRLLSPVSSPSLVVFEFSFRPFKIVDEELPVKITYNIGYLLVWNIEKPRSFEFE